MQIQSKNLLYSLLTFFLAFIVLTFFYHQVLVDPNNYLFAPSGDGIQNYYTYLFHAKYDAEFWNFSGMNYPFQEHVVYAGAQPLLSWLIGVFGIEYYGVGILNFLMLISFPICAVFLVKIFRHYEVPNSISIVAAIAIAFMSPQVFRMTGHLSLSPVFVIPAMWWLMILSNKAHQLKWSIAICVFILWFFFTHPYLGLILLLFGFVFWSANILADKSKWKIYSFKIILQLLVPFIVFQVLILMTDTHLDRLGTPAGFFDYYANWKSIFVAHHGPMSYLTVFFDINIGNWESWNYVGLSTAIFFGTILIYLAKNRKTVEFKKYYRNELVLFFFSAYFILMFSFCFPLKYDFLRGLVDYMGPLKQFRVLGRFAWIFFYVFTVFSIIGFYRIMLKRGSLMRTKILFYGCLGFYFVEFFPAHLGTSTVVSSSPNMFKKEALKPDYAELIDFMEVGKYDAFIFLPFTHLSSENLMLIGTEQGNFDSFILSYHSGKPMFNAIASRMSMSETILMNNFFSREFVEKDLVYLLDSNAKILVVKNNEAVKSDELRLIYSSKKVFENETFKAFDFDGDKWNSSFYFDEIKLADKSAIYDVGQGWKSDTTNVWFYYESFNDKVGENLSGGGALHDLKNGYNNILELNKSQLDTGLYTISFWYYLGVDRADVTAVVEQVFNDGKESFWADTYAVNQSTIIVENWCFVTMDFAFQSDMEKINILITGNGNKQPFYVDEILVLKQNGRALFSHQQKNGTEYLIYNNYWLRSDSFQRQK